MGTQGTAATLISEAWESRIAGQLAPAPTEEIPHRTRMYRLLDFWRDHAWRSQNTRTAKCGRVRHADSVQVVGGAHGARFSGLIRCRSKSCPPCLAARRAKDADAIKRVVGAHRARGGAAYLVTLTIRHNVSHDLADTGRRIRAAWRAFISGRYWARFRYEMRAEYIVAEEVTYGKNGWHPHLHVLLLLPEEMDADAMGDQRAAWHDRWAACVARHIGPDHEPEYGPGVDMRPSKADEYLSKLALELASHGTKSGKGRSPITLLHDASNGDENALNRYVEWANAMRGARDLTWSSGLKSDREAAALAAKTEREAEASEPLATIPGKAWDAYRNTEDAHSALLEAAESGGEHAVWELFRKRGIALPPPIRQKST